MQRQLVKQSLAPAASYVKVNQYSGLCWTSGKMKADLQLVGRQSMVRVPESLRMPRGNVRQ